LYIRRKENRLRLDNVIFGDCLGKENEGGSKKDPNHIDSYHGTRPVKENRYQGESWHLIYFWRNFKRKEIKKQLIKMSQRKKGEESENTRARPPESQKTRNQKARHKWGSKSIKSLNVYWVKILEG